LPSETHLWEGAKECFGGLPADKKADYSANHSADYDEYYGFLKACGSRSVSPAKNRADGGEYADSFDCLFFGIQTFVFRRREA
jgi:hypothetical protein